jgi:hypothetical protein
MRSVVVTASLVTTLWLGLPVVAAAQDPEPAPAPEAPAPPPPPPPRDVAVPRGERTPPRESAPRVRDSSGENREPAGASGRVREPQSAVDGGSRRQPSADAAGDNRRSPAANTAATAAASDEQRSSGAQRRGAVRRPPSGGSSAGDDSRSRNRAVPRSTVPRDDDRPVFVYPNYRYYNRYYDPWGYGGFGLGYFYYAPWAWNSGYYGGGYGGQYSAYGYELGSVKLKVKPRDAEVFVDNYFAGYVDDFDGLWQALKLDRGGYRIELRKPGYEPLRFDVRVQPDRTLTLRGELKPLP